MRCLKSSKTARRLDLSSKSLNLNFGAEQGFDAPCSILLRRAGKFAACKVNFARSAAAAFCLSCAVKFTIRAAFCAAAFVISKIYLPHAHFVFLRLNLQLEKTRSKFKTRNLKTKISQFISRRLNLNRCISLKFYYLASAKFSRKFTQIYFASSKISLIFSFAYSLSLRQFTA